MPGSKKAIRHEKTAPLSWRQAKTKALTPMLAQYIRIKSQAPEALLFYRLGDFYELFFDDAVTAARALDIVLTQRGYIEGSKVPMCGVPAHAYESYLTSLMRKGFKVALCDQIETPEEAKKRGSGAIVKRSITRILTPGTLSEEVLLDPAHPNYLASLYIPETYESGGRMGLAWGDVSTGACHLCSVAPDQAQDLLAMLSPAELILPEHAHKALPARFSAAIPEGCVQSAQDVHFFQYTPESRMDARRAIQAIEGIAALGPAEEAAFALQGLLSYVERMYMGQVVDWRLQKEDLYSGYMQMDRTTRSALGIVGKRGEEKTASLLGVMDRCVSAAGSRRLRSQLLAPSCDLGVIESRLDAVAWMKDSGLALSDLRAELRDTVDLERLLMRLVLNRYTPRDIAALGRTLFCAPVCLDLLRAGEKPVPLLLKAAMAALSSRQEGIFERLASAIDSAIDGQAAAALHEGGFIKPGYHPPLDELRARLGATRRSIVTLQHAYSKKSGIKTIKIRYNNFLGYFLDVASSHADILLKPPLSDIFIHRQTLKNSARFTTQELHQLAGEAAQIELMANRMERDLLEGLLRDILDQKEALRDLAWGLATIDATHALAILATEKDMTRPHIDKGSSFFVEKGRHPVVEEALQKQGSRFVANDGQLADSQGNAALVIVTGPNMAGKSTYLRQQAILSIMAQSGSYVPAARAHLGIVDKIFARIGASDDLFRGRSTFMVEMHETAHILRHATRRSLLIFDELGRGTATYDGMAIAWGVMEHIHDRIKARTLFATHYHELTALENVLAFVKNMHIRVQNRQGEMLFLHQIVPGKAGKSFGLAVAALAGIDPAIIERSRTILQKLEARDEKPGPVEQPAARAAEYGEPDDATKALFDALENLNPDEMAPRAALEALYRLKALTKNA